MKPICAKARRSAVLLALVACLACKADAADVKTVTVGDPANPGALAQSLQDAYNGGARRILIRKGDYTLPVPSSGTTFAITNWKDAVISAYGVSFMITDTTYGNDCFRLNDCTNVRLEGPIISQVSQVMYQGRILSTGHEANGNETCIWKPDAGYPVPPADATKFTYACEDVDQHTRQFKVGVQGFNTPPMTNLGDGTYRITFNAPEVGIVVGDWLVGRGQGHDIFKIYLERCRNCTVKDVTMYRNGFSALREDSGGGNHILGVKWMPGPPPDGGTETPLFCSAEDGIHSTLTNPGPDIEHCVFQGLLDDDCIAIHGNYQAIGNVSGADVTVSNHNSYNYSGLAVGQPVRIDNETFYAEGMVTAMRDNGDGTTTVTLDKDYHIPPKTFLFNPLACGPGYKIIDCKLGNTRSRGIIAKADDGIIRGNTITQCDIGIIAGSDGFEGEAGYSKNVTIEDNTILGNAAQTNGSDGALVIGCVGVKANRNFIVRNNRFENVTGINLQIRGADGVQVSHNTFSHPVSVPGGNNHLVVVTHSANVNFSDNTVAHPASSAAAPLWSVDDTSSNISGLDAVGMKAADPK